MTDFNQHYKERNPKETVALIQRFFEDKGFTILQPLSFQTEAGTWSARVELYDGNLMLNAANGKGMTYDYCQASAYAELYERFCNKCGHINNLAFMKKYMEISKENNGYYLAPGEKILSFEEVINMPSISQSLNTILPDVNAQKGIFDAICDNLYVGVPYMNIEVHPSGGTSAENREVSVYSHQPLPMKTVPGIVVLQMPFTRILNG